MAVFAPDEVEPDALARRDQQLEDIIVDACCELFAVRGMGVGFIERVPARLVAYDGIAAVIGFAGAGMRGSIALYMRAQTVRDTHPTLARRPPEDEEHALRDWAGELANQALGRIKNKLSLLGVRFSLGIPTAISGRELTLVHIGAAAPQLFRFCCGADELQVVWAVEFDDDVVLEPIADDRERGHEGELIEF